MLNRIVQRRGVALLFVALTIIVPNMGAAGSGGGCAPGVPGIGGPPAALVGVWRAQFVDPTFGPGAIELVIKADSTFSQQTNYAAGAQVIVYGNVRVLPDQAILRLDTLGGVPTEQCSTVGCTNIIYPAETHNYSLPNANALTTHNINCAPDQCTYNYARAT
jgi:hypothetical protein